MQTATAFSKEIVSSNTTQQPIPRPRMPSTVLANQNTREATDSKPKPLLPQVKAKPRNPSTTSYDNPSDKSATNRKISQLPILKNEIPPDTNTMEDYDNIPTLKPNEAKSLLSKTSSLEFLNCHVKDKVIYSSMY